MSIRLMIASCVLVAASLVTAGCSDSHWDDAGENWKQGYLNPMTQEVSPV